jgi:hypothetical protein
MMRSAVALLAVLVTTAGRDQAVFRSQTDSVLLDVLATDRIRRNSEPRRRGHRSA